MTERLLLASIMTMSIAGVSAVAKKPWLPIVRVILDARGTIYATCDVSGLSKSAQLDAWRIWRDVIRSALPDWHVSHDDQEVGKYLASGNRANTYIIHTHTTRQRLNLAAQLEVSERLVAAIAGAPVRPHLLNLLCTLYDDLPAVKRAGGRSWPGSAALWSWSGPPALAERWKQLCRRAFELSDWPHSGTRREVRKDTALANWLESFGVAV